MINKELRHNVSDLRLLLMELQEMQDPISTEIDLTLRNDSHVYLEGGGIEIRRRSTARWAFWCYPLIVKDFPSSPRVSRVVLMSSTTILEALSCRLRIRKPLPEDYSNTCATLCCGGGMRLLPGYGANFPPKPCAKLCTKNICTGWKRWGLLCRAPTAPCQTKPCGD